MTIGDVLRRHDGREFRLCGIREGAWVAAPVEHGSLVTLTARDLAEDFGIDNAQPSNPSSPDDDRRGWEALAEASREAADRAQRGDIGERARRLPEDVFAAANAEAEAAKSKGRRRG